MYKLIYKMREKSYFYYNEYYFFPIQELLPYCDTKTDTKTDSFRPYLALKINVILSKWIDVNVSIDDVKGWQQ